MRLPNQRGQLLLEVLLMIGITAVIIGLGAQTVGVATKSNKNSGQRNAAQGLVDETFDAVRTVATESWKKIYTDLTKNANYYTSTSSNAWVLTSGSEAVSLSGINYTRSFIAQNVCRDASTRAITGISDSSGTATTCVTSGGNHDPSTQKVTVTVTVGNSTESISSSEYILRWRNKTCNQTTWSTVSTSPVTCPSGQYETKTNINIISTNTSLTL